jgi:hypothetical protein
VDTVEAAIGTVAWAALGRGDPVPALRGTAGSDDPVVVLTRLWVLGAPVRRRDLDAALPRTGTALAERLHLVEAAGADPDDEVRPWVDLRPHEAVTASATGEATAWWIASDLGELTTGRALEPDHVLGIGGASTTLLQWTPRHPVGRALDVGTGCGVQSFYLATHADHVVATDLSERALAFARFNAALGAAASGSSPGWLELRHGSLLDPVAGELFDLVVSNPPFVITPRLPGVTTYEYRDAGLAGDAVMAGLIAGLGEVLAPGGVAQLLGNWEHHGPEGDWRERVAGWLPDDVDAWVVQREVLDPAQYAQTWARDGGRRPGDPAYDELVGQYLDDFAARGVEAVGLGVVTLRRPAADERPGDLRRLEELTGPVGGGGPMGQTVAGVLAAERWLRDRDDAALLSARLRVADDVTEERFGRPGDPDPQVVLLRQGGGLQRAVRADTALAGLAGACDGELTVGQIVGALGSLLDEPVADLSARLLPQVRGLVADGLLRAGTSGP